MADETVDLVICLWQYKKTPAKQKRRRLNNPWHLVKSYISDGYVHSVSGLDDEMESWVNHDIDGEYGGDYIKGRVITTWSFNRGSSLCVFNPPDYPEWLDSSKFIRWIRESDGWYNYIQGGYDMYLATCDEARKLVRGVK